MDRIQGTLALRRESRHGGNRDGFNLDTALANSGLQLSTSELTELQVWSRHLTLAVSDFMYRQRQREACDRARLVIARRAVSGSRQNTDQHKAPTWSAVR